jgi:hypothetical protein
MLFSDCYKITTNGSEDWFDPILDDDTLLFVDPFLIYMDNQGLFQGGYQKVMDFFAEAFEIAAIIPYNSNSPRFKILVDRLVFPEPKEACLGYSIGSVDGAGSGKGFATIITRAIYDSIDAGLINKQGEQKVGLFAGYRKVDDQILILPVSIRNYLDIQKTENLIDVVLSKSKYEIMFL